MPSGSLPANKRTRILSGWGWYAVDYSISTGAPGGEYRTYPIYSSGTLPNPRITLQVRGYGDLWVFHPWIRRGGRLKCCIRAGRESHAFRKRSAADVAAGTVPEPSTFRRHWQRSSSLADPRRAMG
jgi:hypothetical protein